MIVQALNHSVQSESRGVAQAYVVVKLPTYLSKAVNIQRRLRKLTIQDRLFSNSVENATRATSAEQQRIGSSKDFDLL